MRKPHHQKKPTVKLSEQPLLKCDKKECTGAVFQQLATCRIVSGILTQSGKEEAVLVPLHVCIHCMKSLEQLMEQRNEPPKPDNVLSLIEGGKP